MENKDNIISKALEQIESKKQNLNSIKPQENYVFKTNCRFGEINIKTLNIKQLIKCLMDVYNYKNIKENVSSILKLNSINYDDYNDAFKFFNFNVDEWESDILYLIKKLHYNNELKKLEDGSKQLETFYSKDKQDEIAINNLISVLGL